MFFFSPEVVLISYLTCTYPKFFITADPPITGCPNENKIVTASPNANEAMVTYEEVTSPGNTVTINDNNYRPMNNFPVGFTKVVYTITNTAGAKSFCIFYVVVKGMLSNVFLVSI